MRSLIKYVLFLMIALAPNAMAQKANQISFRLKLEHHGGSYMFRGHQLSSDDAFLAEVGIGMGKWSYTAYLEEGLDIVPGGPDGNGVTHEFAFTNIVGRRIVTSGYRFYDYDLLDLPDTQEIFTRVAYTGRWNPTYGIAFDIDTYKGYYIDGSLTRFWPMSRKSNLIWNIRIGLSYDMDAEFNEDETQLLEPAFFEDNGLNHASTHLKWAWQPKNWFKFETGVDYHYAFDDLLYDEDESFIEQDQIVWRSVLSFQW